jgi:hypothetical protein
MDETRIAADIEALRTRAADTRELYREVCALLFFRYGITPTANRLYQYVRKGSMNTPAEVLSRFWDDLRARTRVRIDHPELPDSLRGAAGTLVAGLWEQARHEAERSLAGREAAMLERVEAMTAERDEARAEAGRERARARELAQQLEAARTEAADLARQLATNQGRLASMTELVRENAQEMHRLRDELGAAHRDVARAIGEGNALRVQLALARRRNPRRPLGGVPPDPDVGQEDLALDPLLPADEQSRDGPAAVPGSGEPAGPGSAGEPPGT